MNEHSHMLTSVTELRKRTHGQVSCLFLSKYAGIFHFMWSFCSKTAVFINDIYANVTIFRVQLGVYFLDKLLNSFLEGKLFL